MKQLISTIALVAVFVSQVCSHGHHHGYQHDGRKYVYYQPALTASSAPHSFEEPRVKRYKADRCCNEVTKRVVYSRPAMTREIVYTHTKAPAHWSCDPCGNNRCRQRVHYVKDQCGGCHKVVQSCRCKPVCRTVNNVVKEVNGGSPRYVVNGTIKICDEPQKGRATVGNYHWHWNQADPHYRKRPVYVDEKHGRSTVYTPGHHHRVAQSHYYYY
ncbi:MAG: hypothetical protein H3C47_07245 [Candidatus Cloacimonetes bacterium]|nr:hypothetical protein [Candidatus Cloacimonadota bacterium]